MQGRRVVLAVPHAASGTDTSAVPVARALAARLRQAGHSPVLLESAVDRAVRDDNRWPAADAPSEFHARLRRALAQRPALLLDVHGYPRHTSGHGRAWAEAGAVALVFSRENPPLAPEGAARDGALDGTARLLRLLAAGGVLVVNAQRGQNSVTEVGLGRGVPSLLLEFPSGSEGPPPGVVDAVLRFLAHDSQMGNTHGATAPDQAAAACLGRFGPDLLALLHQYTLHQTVLPTGEAVAAPSGVVNAYMSTGGEGLAPHEAELAQRLGFAVLDAALHCAVPQPLRVYSGFPGDVASVDMDVGGSALALRRGMRVGWFRHRLTSASLDIGIATHFAGAGPCCVYELNVRPPMRCLPLWPVSAFPVEREVVLPPGYRWVVRATRTERVLGKDYTVHSLECANPDLYEHTEVQRLLHRAFFRGQGRVGDAISAWTRQADDDERPQRRARHEQPPPPPAPAAARGGGRERPAAEDEPGARRRRTETTADDGMDVDHAEPARRVRAQSPSADEPEARRARRF